MGMEFPNANEIRTLFSPEPDGTALITTPTSALTLRISGLASLPDGSQYFLMLVPTPVRAKQESHQE